MLVAAAVLPHPPLLVPAVGHGGGVDLDRLRGQCRAAVDAVAAVEADRTYVVGADVGPRATSFAPWAPGAPGAADPVDVPEPLPLPLLVGAHLSAGTLRSFVIVDPALDPDACAELGHDLAASAARVALLVLGDGAACHGDKAPGYVDDRSAGFDDTVHAALAAADPAALAAVDVGLAAALLVSGRAPWQVLAGAARGGRLRGAAELFVPYGVGYHVATWR